MAAHLSDALLDLEEAIGRYEVWVVVLHVRHSPQQLLDLRVTTLLIQKVASVLEDEYGLPKGVLFQVHDVMKGERLSCLLDFVLEGLASLVLEEYLLVHDVDLLSEEILHFQNVRKKDVSDLVCEDDFLSLLLLFISLDDHDAFLEAVEHGEDPLVVFQLLLDALLHHLVQRAKDRGEVPQQEEV